jgi:colanic acid/amylovoran biosynthesis protein
MTQKQPHVLFLHGVNYWNLGDLGIFQAMVESFRRKYGPGMKGTVVATFGMDEKLRDIQFPVDLDLVRYPLFYPAPGVLRKLRMMLQLPLLPILAKLYTTRPGRGVVRALFPKTSKLFDLFQSADVVVSKGGNFILDTGGRVPTFLLPSHPLLVAAILGTPTVLYAQSVGPFRRRWLLPVVRFILRRMDLLLIREPDSLKLLPSGLDPSRIKLTCDEAFLLEPAAELPPHLAALVEGRTLGATALQWRFPGNEANAEESRGAYYDSMARTMDAIIEREDVNVVFVPHQAKWARENDIDAIREIVKRAKHASRMRIAPEETTPAQAIALIQRCEAFVGTRLHSVIFSIAAGTPAIAVGYLPKSKGTMEMLGLGDWVLSIDTLQSDEIVTRVHAILADPAKSREKVMAARGKARQLARQNVEFTAELAARRGS